MSEYSSLHCRSVLFHPYASWIGKLVFMCDVMEEVPRSQCPLIHIEDMPSRRTTNMVWMARRYQNFHAIIMTFWPYLAHPVVFYSLSWLAAIPCWPTLSNGRTITSRDMATKMDRALVSSRGCENQYITNKEENHIKSVLWVYRRHIIVPRPMRQGIHEMMSRSG
jgi:hypothetical protein